MPGCRRTLKVDGPAKTYRDWVCGKHWPAVSIVRRKRRAKLFKRYKHLYGDTPYWHYPAGSPKRLASYKLDRLCDIAWERCTVQAIERAMGIG